MAEPYSEPQRKSQATTALVLGILGLVCCGVLAPIAWYLGNEELKAINAGRLPSTTEGMARAGMILGIIGTVLLAIGLAFLLFGGGLAFLTELGE